MNVLSTMEDVQTSAATQLEVSNADARLDIHFSLTEKHVLVSLHQTTVLSLLQSKL